MTKVDVIKKVHPLENGLARLPLTALAMVDLDLGGRQPFGIFVFFL